MKQDLQLTIALLERTPKTLDALLRDLPEPWSRANEGGDSWNAFDIVSHLLHGERTDWIPRVARILEYGESKTFSPFDRNGDVHEGEGKSMAQVLDEFAQLRAESIEKLRALKLQPEDIESKGVHPVFGTVTLSQLLATWAMHDMTHLHQLSRVLAYQYRDAVGPWTAYLGVMHCEGHSS